MKTNDNILSYLTTYRCPECLLIQRIYKRTSLNIYLYCKSNHIYSYPFNKDFIINKRIDLSNLICFLCKKNNSLFYYKNCYITLCESCQNLHAHKDYILNLENIDNEHLCKYCTLGEEYEYGASFFCEECIKNMKDEWIIKNKKDII